MAVPRAPRIFSIFVASIIFQQRLSAARENVQLPRCPKIRQLAFEAEFSGGGEKCERNVASAGRGNSPVQGIQISFLRLLTLLIFPRPPLFARSETNKAREKPANRRDEEIKDARVCIYWLATRWINVHGKLFSCGSFVGRREEISYYYYGRRTMLCVKVFLINCRF